MVHGSAVTPERLRDVVRTRRVYYEVTSEVDFVGAERRQVGYELKLWAAHEKGARALPGCPKCWDIVEDLRRIAEWLAEGEEAATRWEVQPFDRALHDSGQFPALDEIDLSLKLLHRYGSDAPLDAGRERCLRNVKRKLAHLGVSEGTWRPVSTGPHRHQ